jgi:hypothetical protein
MLTGIGCAKEEWQQFEICIKFSNQKDKYVKFVESQNLFFPQTFCFYEFQNKHRLSLYTLLGC